MILSCVLMACVVTLPARLSVCVVKDTSWPKEQLPVSVSHYSPIRANQRKTDSRTYVVSVFVRRFLRVLMNDRRHISVRSSMNPDVFSRSSVDNTDYRGIAHFVFVRCFYLPALKPRDHILGHSSVSRTVVKSPMSFRIRSSITRTLNLNLLYSICRMPRTIPCNSRCFFVASSPSS